MIDLHTLDNFATDHLQFEAKCSRCFQNPSFSIPPTDAEVLCGLDRIRSLVMQGAIEEACQICENLCSHPLADPRVQLNVRIHKLFELVHVAENAPTEKGVLRHEALQEALLYSQKLADFALNAFPEAYELFTESMMLFAYPEAASTSAAIQERRAKLADELVSLTRMTTCARESCFSFLIRYLILIFLQFKSPVVTPGVQLDSIEELIYDLLEHGKTATDRPSRISWMTDGPRQKRFNHRGMYGEADVQTLPERVSISRQESIESLRFTDGDVFAALKNELGRVLVNRQRFRTMVVEYCAARGLRVFETSERAAASGASSQYAPLSADEERIVVPEELVTQSALQMFPVMCNLRRLAKSGDFDAFLCAMQEMDPTLVESAPLLDFRIGQCQVLKFIQREEFEKAIETVQQKLGPLAKRNPTLLLSLTETISLLVYAADLNKMEDSAQQSETETETGNLMVEVESEDFVEDVRAGDKRIRHERVPADSAFAGCTNNGEAGSEVQSFDAFLTETFGSVVENASLESIAFEAYRAYEQKFKEPQLIQLLKHLLPTHEEWQTQNMMTDMFAEPLGINEIQGLREEGHASVLPGVSGSAKDVQDGREATSRNGGSVQNSGSQQAERERRRDEERERTVLTLMEFLAMSRAEALAVVRNHPQAQNAQTIIDSLLGTMP